MRLRSRCIRYRWGITLLACAALVAGCRNPPARAPDPSLRPEEVVQLQLDALRENDRPERDAGIAVAFRFASPENRAAVGPLRRFAGVVKRPPYAVLVNHRKAYVGRAFRTGSRARVRVAVVGDDGSAAGFIWELSRQQVGENQGSWLTDGVVPQPLSFASAAGGAACAPDQPPLPARTSSAITGRWSERTSGPTRARMALHSPRVRTWSMRTRIHPL
ncbi:hypothetical protein BH20GEM2_BH20GEM2_01050 [soil metagenome]